MITECLISKTYDVNYAVGRRFRRRAMNGLESLNVDCEAVTTTFRGNRRQFLWRTVSVWIDVGTSDLIGPPG
jgi:hypothetical protein